MLTCSDAMDRTHNNTFLISKYKILLKPVYRGVDSNLHFPTSSIKPSLHHFQFCRFLRSLEIHYFSLFKKGLTHRPYYRSIVTYIQLWLPSTALSIIFIRHYSLLKNTLWFMLFGQCSCSLYLTMIENRKINKSMANIHAYFKDNIN
jgi:hypothetical protein